MSKKTQNGAFLAYGLDGRPGKVSRRSANQGIPRNELMADFTYID